VTSETFICVNGQVPKFASRFCMLTWDETLPVGELPPTGISPLTAADIFSDVKLPFVSF
jgi:hypothetical protein